MKVREIFDRGERAISFEFFPPKTDKGMESLYTTVEDLRGCRPSYVSVTYGAGGSTRDRTLDLVARIKKELGMETVVMGPGDISVAHQPDETLRVSDLEHATGLYAQLLHRFCGDDA